MSIGLQVRVKDNELQMSLLMAKCNALQSEVHDLKSRLDALEARPKPGRPPKEQDGRQPTSQRD